MRGLDGVAGADMSASVLPPATPYRWTDRGLPGGSVRRGGAGTGVRAYRVAWLTIVEIARILRDGGLAFIIAPSAGPVHRFPRDCWRYYPDGFPALAAYAGLEVVETHWDDTYAYPECAFWGEACAVLQRPRRGGDASVIAPASSSDAVARRVEERLATLRPGAVRRYLLAELARRAWFILRSPLPLLRR